jgi:hypothetical protein
MPWAEGWGRFGPNVARFQKEKSILSEAKPGIFEV